MTETDRFVASAQRAERDAIRSAAGDCSGLRILNAGDAGSALLPPLEGAILRATGCTSRARFSHDLHSANRAAFRLPFRDQDFDRAISAQALPHIAGADRRSAYLREISRVLKPDGKLIVTTMHFSFRFQKKGALKEGWEDGVHYHRYLADEFREELEACFNVERMHGFWIYLPKTFRLYMSLGRASVYWERALRNRPLSLKYGKFLLAICRPKANMTL